MMGVYGRKNYMSLSIGRVPAAEDITTTERVPAAVDITTIKNK